MAIQSWQNIIDLIRNGEPVSAEVANRAINQLVQRTEHLKARQDAQSLAQAVFISGAPLAIDVQTGNVVYFDAASNKFAAAYADVEFKNGLLRPTSTSNVVGVVIYKDTADSGVIVLDGWINPSQYEDLDCQYVPMLDNLLVNPDFRGILYLASGAQNAGKLSDQPGFINVPVCNLVSATNMLIRPPITTTLDTEALKFRLSNGIAGPELILEKRAGVAGAVFAAGFPAVGSNVKVYLGNTTPITSENLTVDEIAVYLTATVEQYATFLGGFPSRVYLKNVKFTDEFVKAVNAANGDYSTVFTAATTTPPGIIKLKVINDVVSYIMSDGTTPATTSSCYVSPVASGSAGWSIISDLTNTSKPGWLPVNSPVFNNSIIPLGAVYGYNVKQDPILQQLFPESIVTAYSVTKDGVALSNIVVEVNSSGIWWKDPFNQLPWHQAAGAKNLLPDVQINLTDWTSADSAQIIMPSELHLVYAKLNIGGAKMVTSLETTPNSVLSITDPFGNPANSGPLVIKANFTVGNSANGNNGNGTNGTNGNNGNNGNNGTNGDGTNGDGTNGTNGNNAEGSLVVKDITNDFVLIKGPVVERIVAGDNIVITSFINNGGSNGTNGTNGTNGNGNNGTNGNGTNGNGNNGDGTNGSNGNNGDGTNGSNGNNGNGTNGNNGNGTNGNNGNGQGIVTISVVGLDGKLEGQPDILAVDDVLVERDSTFNMFYSVFPKGKSSSILGKIDVPNYIAANNYNVELHFIFTALHSNGSVTPPSLTLSLLELPAFSGMQNLNTSLVPTPIIVTPWDSPVAPRACFKKIVNLPNKATPGSLLFFKLSRSSSDEYTTKFGLISTIYKFVKSTS